MDFLPISISIDVGKNLHAGGSGLRLNDSFDVKLEIVC